MFTKNKNNFEANGNAGNIQEVDSNFTYEEALERIEDFDEPLFAPSLLVKHLILSKLVII